MVHLAGEGTNELGTEARHHSYRDIEPFPGVLEALLRSVQFDGWRVSGATAWKRIRKYRAKGPTPNEALNVLGLVEQVSRTEARVVAFSRDSDGDDERVATIAAAIERAREKFPTVQIIGGTAVPVLEAWILALEGVRGTERLSQHRAQSDLLAKGLAEKDTNAMVAAVQAALPNSPPPDDARSLHQWLAQARAVLPPLVERARATPGP